ncbi:MAG: hypothetical protein HIU91_10065 [Acidobacteria bacterium]|nr:hypothetical protein [Acidobacteriota bacterium]
MSSTLVMNGLENLEGRQFGTLRTTRMVRRSPEPAYAVVCERCSTESTATHTRLRNGAAVCRNSSCGKTAIPNRRDLLAEQRRIAAEREADASAAAAERAASRMQAETQDYERPSKYAPKPGPKVMTQRERDSLREFREAEEAEQRAADAPRIAAEREQAERIVQLQEENVAALRQLRAVERERVLNLPDEEFRIDPSTVGASGAVPLDKLASWHAAQSTQFLADNPQYYRCPENEKAIIAYIERNAPGIKLLSAVQLTAAYRRLRDLGLLRERPAPVMPEPEPVERLSPPPPVEKPVNPLDELVDGWEIDGSAPRKWTGRELERLSGDDYRRALRLYKADLELPNVGPSVRPR